MTSKVGFGTAYKLFWKTTLILLDAQEEASTGIRCYGILLCVSQVYYYSLVA